MKEKKTLGVVFRGSETEVGFLRPSEQRVFYKMQWIPARVQRTGMENPRCRIEAPETRMTLESRQRQLHDEDKSCGNQPAYIRMIYRRLSSCALTGVHRLNKINTKYKKDGLTT